MSIGCSNSPVPIQSAWTISYANSSSLGTDRRHVITDPAAGYSGIAVNDRSLTPSNNTRTGATHFADWLSRGKFKPSITPFKTLPRICAIEVFPSIAAAPNEQVLQDGQVSCSHGTRFGNVQQFASFLLMNNVWRNQQDKLRQIDDAAALEVEGKKAKVEFTPDHPHVIRLLEEEYPLTKLSFVVHFSKSNAAPAGIKSEFHFQFAPHICRIETIPPITDCTPAELRAEGRLVCTCCGKDHGTLNQWASQVVFAGVFQRQPEIVKQFQDGLRRSPDGQAWLHLTWKIDDKKVIRFRGNDHAARSVSIGVHAISAKGPLHCKHYELAKSDGEGQLLSHLEATAGGKKFNIVIPHSEGGYPEKIVLKIHDARKPAGDPDSIQAEQKGSQELGHKLIQAIQDKIWENLTPRQKVFLSLPELSREESGHVIRESGSTAWLSACGKSIQLTMIRTEPSQRRQGHASKLLDRVCKLADKVGITLSLRAEPKDAEIDMDQPQLVAWYGRHGFKGDWNNMTRPPSNGEDSP